MINSFYFSREKVITKLSNLPVQFTLEQKSAIMVSLLKQAKIDGVIEKNDSCTLEKLLKLLQIEENSLVFQEVYNAGHDKSLSILKKLWNNQKEYYVLMLHGLMEVRFPTYGPTEEGILPTCDKINITEKDYYQILTKLNNRNKWEFLNFF